ncbi:MAG TPA: response regulator transcription factor [Anaerolineae bacterium]|nr:response regulator transcription factor [Anaerolineae bacterium]
MVRVLIVDDQTVVREGLAAILGTDPEIEVVGLAENGQQALEMVPEGQPDLVLMDLKMPVLNGVQATRRLRQQHPQVRVLVLTTYAADDWVLDAIAAGAAGYLLKDTRRAELLDAIKGTAQGRSYLDPSIAGRVMERAVSQPLPPAPASPPAEPLTEREQQILVLLARGYSNPEIAQRLHLARGTVRNYVSAILQKLGASDRTEAAVLALRRGLVGDGE